MGPHQKKQGVAAVVLAAGMSRRMGTAKQLLRLEGKTVLERTLGNVRASQVGEIVLVLGHAAEQIEKEVATSGLKVVRHQSYEQGMGSSLRAGLAAVGPEAAAALIILADQPFVQPATLNKLIECHRSADLQIVIPTYRGFRGNPVLLDRSVFPEISQLNGDVGCRAIFGSRTQGVHKLEVDDPGILMDIDTGEDFEKLSGTFLQNAVAAAPAIEGRKMAADAPELVLVGRHALTIALAKMAQVLKFSVTVVDPFMKLEEFPEADRVLNAMDFNLLPESTDRHVVVASRGQFDEEALEQGLRSNARYVALVGNRKRAQELTEILRERGIAMERLWDLHAPAGLDIGAESPEEIALSIIAEIVAARRQQERE